MAVSKASWEPFPPTSWLLAQAACSNLMQQYLILNGCQQSKLGTFPSHQLTASTSCLFKLEAECVTTVGYITWVWFSQERLYREFWWLHWWPLRIPRKYQTYNLRKMLNPFQTNEIYHTATYNKVRMVHCIHWGVTCRLEIPPPPKKILYFFLWGLSLS